MAAKSTGRRGWLITLVFSGGMIKSISGYLLLIQHSEFAYQVLRIGEPFMSLAFLAAAYTVFKSKRT